MALKKLVLKDCNFVVLGQIIEKSNGPRIEAILHIVLNFQFDRACVTVWQSSTQTQ